MKKFISFAVIILTISVLLSCGGKQFSFSGTIRDAITLEPIINAQVEADGKTSFTDDKGMFLVTALTDNKVDVLISKDGYVPLTFPEFVLNEDDKNFLEATMDKKGEAKNIPSKEFGKPQPNPPPLSGTPVTNRPVLKIIDNLEGFLIKLEFGDQKLIKNTQYISISKDVKKVSQNNDPRANIGSIISTKDIIYNFDGKNWMGVKIQKGQPLPDILSDFKVRYKTIIDCYNTKGSQLNSLGSIILNNIECNKFRMVGFTNETASKVDGTIYVPKSGQYKDSIIYFEGILEVNGPGDKLMMEFKPNAVKSIEIPKNAIIQTQPTGPGGR